MLTLDDIDPEQILTALNDTATNVNEAETPPPFDDEPTLPGSKTGGCQEIS